MRCGDDAVWLNENGNRVIAVANPYTPLLNYFQKNNLNVKALKARNYLDIITVVKLVRIFRENNVQAIHLHRTQDLVVALMAADLADVPNRVLTLRMESKRSKKDIYHRWAYSRLTNVLTITERMKGLVRKNIAVNAEKVKVLYNGYDLEKLKSEAVGPDEIRVKWGIPADAFVAGIVGRLEEGKGQHLLLKAVRQLIDKIPNLYIMIVGDETINRKGELARLKKTVTEFRLSARVKFTGFQSPPGIIVPAFDVSVLASKKETFGGVLVEAMALGVPVIGSNAGGVPEIIEHGLDGLLFKTEDQADLANSVYKLFLTFPT